ncbi:MAG: hypothetical protein JW995_00820 [Melioribacteraceae bacterium]|nr:hypothetical protein [Melioribacteraceae bacterium]
MSYLSIVYASLLIFGGLFLFVLTVSYISYRFKNQGKFALASTNSKNIPSNSQEIKSHPIIVRKNINNIPPFIKEDNYYRNKTKEAPKELSRIRKNNGKDQDKTEKQKFNGKNYTVARGSRMSIIDNLSNYNNASTKRSFSYTPSNMEFTRYSEKSLLRFYEDF